ncbi:hypothetical protein METBISCDRAFT_29125 [Metschnikowia bicuspidata]|uniref:Uncharacterized protein n=1 Tax=Metschnikowia bicuspidata TaxID=27322 RepID=A0A4P9Z6Y8_9ASCO|nr:hypothetical protein METBISCDRAFT_29125 [Metschnikowia bicuspidata]
MKAPPLLTAICASLLLAVALANHVALDEGTHRLVCEGMYSKKDWGGPYAPHIEITLNRLGDKVYSGDADAENLADVAVSYALFELKDIDYLGKMYEKSGRKKYICDDVAISAGLCEKADFNMFLYSGDLLNTTVRISQFDHLGPANLSYPVLKTGYYCISTFVARTDAVYRGTVDFQNAFGQLSASEIPKLIAYGILTVAYAATLGFFAFQLLNKRDLNQILPLQRYLAGMLVLLTLETLVVWSYYDLVNRTVGNSWFVNAYAVFLSVLSSVKITLCLFLLMLVSLGYGIVVLKLPKKVMLRCKVFAAVHFTATMVYLLGNYLTGSGSAYASSQDVDETDHVSSWLGVFIYVPVAVTLCLYYVFILSSMRKTSAKLHKQRQVIKLKLLENLFNLVILSWTLSFSALFFPVIFFFSYSDQSGFESKWKYWFFFSDFWPSISFFVIFLGVSWLWRPTETSYMLAVSQQLSTNGDEPDDGTEPDNFQNQHEFELDDISLMSHSDDENAGRRNRDSFDLETPPAPSAPPNYKEVLSETADHEHASNTLFELDDEDGTATKGE